MSLIKYKPYLQTNKIKNYNKTWDFIIAIPLTTADFPGLSNKWLETKRKKIKKNSFEREVQFLPHKKKTKINANETFYYHYKTWYLIIRSFRLCHIYSVHSGITRFDLNLFMTRYNVFIYFSDIIEKISPLRLE